MDDSIGDGEAGASASREYARRERLREQRAREKFGFVGALFVRMTDGPTSTTAWRQGADAEVRTAARLSELCEGDGIKLLHDRHIPRHGRANIDHIAVGPGGVTVIDTKAHRGKVRVAHVGGLLARRKALIIAGRDRTSLIDGVERQLDAVRSALESAVDEEIDVRGALCFPDVAGLPVFSRPEIREIRIDGPRVVARLASRPGPLDAETIHCVWAHLEQSFPPA